MSSNDVVVYEPLDVFESIERFQREYGRCKCAMFDPWYNKGFGGVRDDYVEYITGILEKLSEVADHIYFWGFPEIVAKFIDRIPPAHQYNAWLTWYYKNNPSVIRGWRSAQMTCLHMSAPGAKMYPEHFLNEAQLAKQAEGKLRYMPGPPSVIESALIIGFVGKKEQTGHPSQKPMAVYEPLIEMVTKPGDLVFDPMCGSGTTGAVCRKLGRRAVLSDINPEYLAMVHKRLELPEQTDVLETESADGQAALAL
ncbi:site-specific DNA-methyltransferase [Pseudomonas aeruginosa]|uniref:DNA-methyltransferase n=1 Tax=Pseudomonas aeruginosa TaxID=287 RepID=UPI0022ACBDCC|nr:site-specific DNA-methyltransferase [Pseudomonas aeruginosa]MDV7779926.1 site-specific DNA-methyltransferase [Pseudomonas aeruginosa]HCT8042088.1 site-specific DNA-methyltransferase [Pseudomonas aeruginosa]